MSFDYLLTDRQTQSSPFAGRLGGYKKVEDLRQQLRRYTRAIVGDLYVNPGMFSISSARPGSDLHLTPLLARIDCVVEEIDQRSLQRSLIAPKHGEWLGQIRRHLHSILLKDGIE